MKTLKNYFFTAGYQLFSIIVPLITMPYVSRILGPEGLGINNSTFSFAQIFVIVSMLGTQKYGSLCISKYREDKDKIYENFSGIYSNQLILNILMFFLYNIIVYIFFEEYLIIYFTQSIYLLSSAIDVSWYFQGKEKFDKVVIRSIFAKILGLILIFCLVKTEADIGLYTGILAGSMLLSNIIMFYTLFKTELQLTKLKIKLNRIIFGKTFSLFLPTAILQITLQATPILIAILLSQKDVGFYSNALKIISIPMYLVTSLITVLFPRIVFENTKLNSNSKELIKSTFHLLICLLFPLILGLSLLSKNLVVWFFGKDFIPVQYLIIILTGKILPTTINEFIGNLLMIPYGETKRYTSSLTIGSIMSLALGVLFSLYGGIVGMTIGLVLGDYCTLIILLIYNQQKLKNIFSFKVLICIFNSIVMGLSILVVTSHVNSVGPLLTVLQIFVGLITYGILTWWNAKDIVEEGLKIFKN